MQDLTLMDESNLHVVTLGTQPSIAAGTSHRVRLVSSVADSGLIARDANGLVCITWRSWTIWMVVRHPERLN